LKKNCRKEKEAVNDPAETNVKRYATAEYILSEKHDTPSDHCKKAGNPAVSALETLGFLTPPHDGCSFISFPALTRKPGTMYPVS